MNISELTKGIAEATGTSDTEAKKTITAVFDQIATAAAKGEEVAIPGFGKFIVKDRPERQGCNPANGEAITASKKVSFTPAKGLKDKLWNFWRRLCGRRNTRTCSLYGDNA